MAPGVEGRVDALNGGMLHGWAWAPGRAQDALAIEVLLDGEVIATALADLFRADLETHGKRGGYCAFRVALDVPLGRDLAFEVRADGQYLEGGPFTLPADQIPLSGPLDLSSADGVRGVLESFGPEGLWGWIHWPGEPFRAVELELVTNGVPRRVTADYWRTDLEDLRQGNGAGGINFKLDGGPQGGWTTVDLRLDGRSLLPKPLNIVLPQQPAAGVAPQPRPSRKPAPDLTVVVVFYNMRREAARTLHSLTRAYQQGAEDLDYEVICIDNGSKHPVDEAFVAAFGPEFRLFKPSRILPSPCFALNEAAATARGRHVAMMIDGAHILSPGLLSQALQAMEEGPDVVFAPRQWFVGGDQRWLSACGYSRDLEDVLFAKIAWPSDGYRLFQISTPMYESPNHWIDGMIESNCLFLPTELYRAIGGFDEGFSEPGAGFANLDLFNRAAQAASAVISPVGEATFHQYHGGTTTNVTDYEKDSRVGRYADNYERLKGFPYKAVDSGIIQARGVIKTDQALTARQHLMFPGGVGVTDMIRPLVLEDWFDDNAQVYARTVYLEAQGHEKTLWQGLSVGVAPADLIILQQILADTAPKYLVVADDRPGLAAYLVGTMRTLGLDCVVIHVRARHDDTETGAIRVEGAVDAPETLANVRDIIGEGGAVMVVFEPPESDAALPERSLSLYAELVTRGAYLVFLRSAIGQPFMGYSTRRPLAAIRRLVARGAFVIDQSWKDQFLTACPSGYLRRAT